MGADQAVGAEPADEEGAEQQPEITRARSFEQCRERDGERVAGGAGRGGLDLGLAEGGQPDIARTLPHQQHHQRDDDQGRAGDAEHGGAPAELLDDHGEQRQEQQLPGRRAGGQHAHHEAALFGEPAVDDRGAQDEGGHAGPRSDHHAPQQDKLPGRCHQRRQRPRRDATSTSDITMVVRTPKRSMKAAANGPISP